MHSSNPQNNRREVNMSHVQSDIVFLCTICGILHHIITKCYNTKVWTVAAQQQSTKVTYRLMRPQLKPCFKTTRMYIILRAWTKFNLRCSKHSTRSLASCLTSGASTGASTAPTTNLVKFHWLERLGGHLFRSEIPRETPPRYLQDPGCPGCLRA
jgi:hypothetical protein